MTVRPRSARRGIRLFGSLSGAVLLVLAVVLPALGSVGPARLDSPTVDPRVASAADPITFTVRYRSTRGLAPVFVLVRVGSNTYAMTGDGTDWSAGVTFVVTTTLPVGTNSVRFEARDTHDSSARADGGSVTIGPAPTPIPEPTPTPTAAPTPRPEPTSAPAHAAGPTEPSATPAPPLAATQVPPRSGEAGSSPTASDIPAGGTAGGGSTTGSGSAAPGGSGSATPGGSGTADGGANTNPLTWLSGSIGAQFAALGLQGPGHLPTIPAVLGSTIAVGTWMAFMFFKGRRRDDDLLPPGPVLQAAAAAGLGVAPGSGYVPQLDPESLMPRWRRPSLIEARKTDPIRKPAPAQPALSFAREYGTAASGEGTASGPERRRVRYAVTPILDRPDELLGTRIGELAGGDEVQVEGRRGAYCDVVSPDGCRGWVHRTTLGDIVPGIRTFENSGPDPEAVNALAALLSARGFSR